MTQSLGMTSTFGVPVPAPNLDKLAKTGLAYTRFHTTALCSPTRAALLTGRNHHSIASAGWSLYVMNDKPVFRYTFFDIADVTIPGETPLPEGKVTLKTEFTPDGSKEGGGDLKLLVDDKLAGEGKLTRSAFRHGLEPFEVGRDSITSIDPAYKDKGKFPFTGTIETVTFDLSQK